MPLGGERTVIHVPKLVYVYGDDNKLLETLVRNLRDSGYSIEYTNIADELTTGKVSADIALICKPVTPTKKLSLGGLTIDLDNMTAYAGDTPIHFTPTEFSMLSYLMRNASRAVPRKELLPTVWGFENDPNTRVADDTVKRLRKKLKDTNLAIETIWGYGFRAKEIRH